MSSLWSVSSPPQFIPLNMSKILKPQRLDLDHNSVDAAKEWKHWKRTFQNFIDDCGDDAPDKFCSIVNCVSASVFEYIEECTTYESVQHCGCYLRTDW